MYKVAILGVLQQQAEALGTQFPPIQALYNKNDWNTNINEMISSDSVTYTPYKANGVMQETYEQLRIILKIYPDVLYINSLKQLVTMGFFIRLLYILRRRPIIIATSHNSVIWNNLKKRKFIAVLFDLFADGILSLAKFQENILINNGVSKSKICTIPNPIDIKQFSPDLNIINEKNSEDPILVNIGEQNPLKNQETIIRALVKIKKEFPKIKLILAGGRIPDPEYSKFLDDLISQLDVKENVKNIGYIEHLQIPNLLRNSDIFVFSSLSEVCPFVILEAMASGMVTISTPVGGIPDLIEDNKNGFLVNSKDHNGFADCILKVLKDQDMRKKIEKNARETAESRFSYHAVGKKHGQFIKEVLNNNRKSNDEIMII